jgi:hypothetical protein
MIGFAGLISGAVLLLLLLAVLIKGWLASRSLESSADIEDVTEPCPEEFITRVFSSSDWDFVRGVKSPIIKDLFQRERKKVALVWIRQTSKGIRQVLRQHTTAARQSQNLEPLTEFKIVSQFLALIAACSVLSLCVHVAGPLSAGWLARFAQRLAVRVRLLQESFQAGVLAQAAPGQQL